MTKKNLIPLIAISILISIIASADDSWMLYDDSQVAKIEIIVDPNALEWMYNNVHSDVLHPASIHFQNAWIDESVDSVGLRLRGNTSRTAQKKSFKLSFNTFVPGGEFYSVDKMNLNGEHNDPTIARSKICWDLFQQVGVKSSRASHAQVYINDEYYGLYLSVEHIDDEFLEKNFDDDSGNLWKCLWPASLGYRGENPEEYKFIDNGRRAYDLKRNEDEDDYSQIARLCSILELTPDAIFSDSLESIIDVPNVLKYLAMDVLTGSWDDYWFNKNNFYLYHEPSKDKFYLIPYDYDNTFGIDWFWVDWASVNPYTFNYYGDNRPLAQRIMANAQYKDLYTHFLQFFADNVYNLSLLDASIDNLENQLTPFAESDNYRTLDHGFSMNDFHGSYSLQYNSLHVKRGIKEFISTRTSTLANTLDWEDAPPIVYAIDYHPMNPSADEPVYFTISAFASSGLEEVEVEVKIDGNIGVYPMNFQPIEGTTIVEEKDRWIGQVPALGENTTAQIRILARDNLGQIAQYPRSQSIIIHTPAGTTSGIVINELLASNQTVNRDEHGEYDDWIELFNTTDQSIDLTGMYLTDNLEEPTKWQFDHTTLPANDFLLIWADDDVEQGKFHANFKLSTDGEDVGLFAPDGITLVDAITFSSQSTDVSYGRSVDGGSDWQFFDSPTPGKRNFNNTSGSGYDMNGDGIIDITDIKKAIKAGRFHLDSIVSPNPFKAAITITFELPIALPITAKIYDIHGRLIKNILQNQMMEEGTGYLQWSGDDYSGNQVTSGIYFIQIEILGYKTERKLVLIR